MSFIDRKAEYVARVDAALERALPPADLAPVRLHEAMRYAVLNGGKRVRPLLVYAGGECLGVAPERLDPAAVAIELIHAFSLVHDDLPAMDDDDLRRGRPTLHRRYDEATAILAADALQPLAFGVVADDHALTASQKTALVSLLAQATGSRGMTGGQAIDIAATGSRLDAEALETMHRLKTGALIRAALIAPCRVADGLPAEDSRAIDSYAGAIGLAFQIRDDLLDVEGTTAEIGKQAGSDARQNKATWPALFGADEARRRCEALIAEAREALGRFGERANPLLELADFIVARRL